MVALQETIGDKNAKKWESSYIKTEQLNENSLSIHTTSKKTKKNLNVKEHWQKQGRILMTFHTHTHTLSLSLSLSLSNLQENAVYSKGQDNSVTLAGKSRSVDK